MNQKSLFSLIGLVVFISVSVGCKASNPVQTQSAVENSQSAGTQSMEYDKRKVEDTLMKYFDSLNKDSLDVYNSVVKKTYQMQRKDWDALQQDLVNIKNIEINFNNTTSSDGTIKVPVKFTQIMEESFLPTNINPSVNNVTRDFFLKIDAEGKYYIADFSSVY